MTQQKNTVVRSGGVDEASSGNSRRRNDAYGDRRPTLSERERQVLLGWLASDSKSEAAQRLYISTGTMNTHLTRIRAKYAAVGRPAATKAALFARALQDGYTELIYW